MATVIRFARHGTKKRPYFRLVVQDSRAPRDGKFIEHIGSFNPIQGQASFKVERPRLEYWLGEGAIPSQSVEDCLKRWKKQVESGVATFETSLGQKQQVAAAIQEKHNKEETTRKTEEVLPSDKPIQQTRETVEKLPES